MKRVAQRRRKLNEKQLTFLKLLYRFRFATTELMAQAVGKNDSGKVYRSLRTLHEQGYIGRNFEPNYRLRGQFASYFLLPDGVKALRNIPDNNFDLKTLHNIHKDKTASEQFVNHNLAVFQAYCFLKRAHGEDVQFFTKSDLTPYDYFPQPLPDAYVRLQDGEDTKQFYLEIFEEHRPFFVVSRRIKQYIDFKNSGQWDDTNTDFPVVLFVADTPVLQRRILKKINQFTDAADLNFAATNIVELASIDEIPEIWTQADSEEVRTPLASLGYDVA